MTRLVRGREGVVVGGALLAGGADGGEGKAMLQEVEIQRESADATVAVDERVDLGEEEVKIGGDLDRMAGGGSAIPSEKSGHEIGHFERIRRDVARTGNTHGHGAVTPGPLVFDAVEDKRVELEQDRFGE